MPGDGKLLYRGHNRVAEVYVALSEELLTYLLHLSYKLLGRMSRSEEIAFLEVMRLPSFTPRSPKIKSHMESPKTTRNCSGALKLNKATAKLATFHT